MTDATYELLAGRYELHRQLATGGSADVFLARDQLLNRPVAVKVLSPELASDAAFVARLRQEAQVVASLNHQNIVGIFEQGEQEGAPFIVMEYVEGRSLADILRNEGRLHPDRAATIAVDVAAALDAAHRQGIVHMDVKPGNVLITPDGQVKLADFGIAKALNGTAETDMTIEEGNVLGTATYLSPEQAQGRKVGPRSDVYSLAVVLYEMMTGRPPFIGNSPAEIARKHVDEAPQPPRRFGVNIAQSLEAITLKGLAKSPVNRYPSVRDFAADLKRYLGGAHSLNGSNGSAAPKPEPDPRPVTGRSTAPEIEDATVIMPAMVPSEPSEPILSTKAPVARPATPAVQAPQAAQPQVLNAQPIPTPTPVVHRSDDTWKRNVLFFIALMVLSVLLGFLAMAFLDVLRTDETDTADEPDVGLETVELRNVVGLDVDQAVSQLERQGLVAVTQTASSSDVEVNFVFRQDPPAGQRVEPNSEVVITVNTTEGLEIPSVIGETEEQATRRLRSLGFEVQSRPLDSDIYGPGEVFRQEPLAGEKAERGTIVIIDVSLGESERIVPDLAGLTQVEMFNDLSNLGFRISQITEPSDEVDEGIVIRTVPEADSLLRGGETITVYISSGVALVPVPAVVSLLADSAEQILKNAGFLVDIDFEPTEDPAKVNVVIDQSPAENLEVEAGSRVRIVIGQEPPPEETTTTVAPETTTTVAPETTTTTEAP